MISKLTLRWIAVGICIVWWAGFAATMFGNSENHAQCATVQSEDVCSYSLR